jgi:hypothetical protein
MGSVDHPLHPGFPPGVPLPPQQAGYTLRRAIEHLRELDDDSADLTVAGGDTVRITCVATVREWLFGLAIRAEAGERL